MAVQDEQSYRERWGLAATVRSACLRRLRRWFGLRLYGIYAHAIDAAGDPDPVVPGFSARLFQPGEAEALLGHAKSPALELSDTFVRSALDKGDVCLAVLHDGAIVAYTWCAFTPTHDDDGVFIRFGKNYRYVYKTFTLPEYRGRHLLRPFTPIRDRYCVTTRGCTRSIAYIDLDNHASIRFAIAIGQRRLGTAGYVKWGLIFLPFATPRVRKQGFGFFMQPQP